MNVLCSAKPCPVLLSTTCVFYEGENLIYTGINTNDSVQVALKKIDETFSNAILDINAVLPISVTAGPNPIISISQASATSNGYISSTDWNIFNNKQNAVTLTTVGSTGASTFNGVSGALNIPDYSAAFPGFVPITRTLSINGTSYDLSANRTWNVGTVTSVGITMPPAFNVSNSPITSSGVIGITAAGLASQYVRGDGLLGDFPSGGGGGSAVSYYLNGSVNQGTFGGSTYYELNKTPVVGGPGVNFGITNTSGLISQFITDPLDPGLLLIPAGNWNIEFYFSSSDATGAPYFYVELYVYNGTTFTLISSGVSNPEYITNGTSVDIYYTSIAVPETIITVNDRFAIRVYGNTNGNRTITLHTEDDNLSQIITTFSNGLTALNGLTRQVQYFATGTTGTDFAINSSIDIHTFNLPTASATNRGALSSADWITFNSKVGGTGAAGQVAYWNGTGSQTGSNNLFWDAANSRLGIGTNSPAYRLHSVGTSYFDAGASGDAIFIPSDGFIRFGNVRFRGFASSFGFLDSAFNTRISFSMSGSASYFNTGGNYVFGGSVDSGQRLQVQGDAFIKGSGATSATTGLTIQNSGATQLLTVRNDGIIFAGNTFTFSNTGTTTRLGFSFATYSNNISSGSLTGFNTTFSFTPDSGNATYTGFHFNTGINQTGTASGITRGIWIDPVITTAANWRSIEWSNNSGWGLYGAGTSANYLGGNLGIGNTSITNVNLRISRNIEGSTSAYGVLLDGSIRSGVTSQALGFTSGVSLQNSAFTLSQLRHFYAIPSASFGSATVTNQTGFYVENTLTGATNNYGFVSDIPNGTNRWNLYMNGTADNYLAGSLGIGTTSLTGTNVRIAKVLTGSTSYNQVLSGGQINSDVTGVVNNFASRLITQAATFTLSQHTHFRATDAIKGAGSTVIINAGYYSDDLTFGNANYGFYGNVSSGTDKWNIYMNGTASNYLGGNLLVKTTTDTGYAAQITSATGDNQLSVWGATSPSIRLDNAGSGATQRFVIGLATATNNFITGSVAGDICLTTQSSSPLIFGANSAEVMRLSPSANVLIGTATDSGYKLDVQGSGRFTGEVGIKITPTTSAILRIQSGSTSQSQIKLESSTAPTSPNNGDIWFTGSELKIQVGGVTKTFTLV